MIEGIDVSIVQTGTIWPQVADAGFRFAFIKASEGIGYRDPTFDKHRKGATDSSLVCGAYHFARFNNPESEAKWFWAACEQLGYNQFELPPVCDLEAQPPSGWKPPQVMAWLKAFMATLAGLSQRKPILYTGPYYWQLHGMPEEWLLDHPLWVAQYSRTGPWHPGPNERPNVPHPWGDWTLWQYSGNGGARVPGVPVDCDRNLFNGSWEQLIALAGVDDPALEPTVTDLSGRPSSECGQE